jgi:hypothetical protein
MAKFNVGDVVKYITKNGTWKYGALHVIVEVEYQGQGVFEYSTTRGAWFQDEDFELVRKADAESLAEIDAFFADEYGDEL